MAKTTVTFGEIMLRLAPPGFERILQTGQFVATFGGGEANVAVALAQLGLPAAFVTVLPDKNPVADAVVGEMSVVLHTQTFLVQSQTRARAAAVAATGAPATAASTGALPIIGPCQSPSTGSSSVTQPSNGLGVGHTAKPCSGAGERD